MHDKSQPIERRDALAIAANSRFPKIRKPRTIHIILPFDLPELTSVENAEKSIAQIRNAAKEGKISPEDADKLIAYDEAYVRTHSTLVIDQLAERVKLLEDTLRARSQAHDGISGEAVTSELPTAPGHEGILMRHEPELSPLLRINGKHLEAIEAVTVLQSDRVWAGDMTVVATGTGWLHLAVLLDPHGGSLAGRWATSAART